jgi:tight adherence protein B
MAVGRSRLTRFGYRQPIIVLVIASASAIGAGAGVLVGLSAAVVLTTLAVLVSAELAARREQHDLAEMLAATRTLAREVRSGAAPVAAVIASASAHRGFSAQVLETLAVEVAADRGRSRPAAGLWPHGGPAAELGARLARGWALSSRYGVPWAALVETVSLDLADQVRARAQRTAQVSGPRVSGYVLALLPGLGLLLGIGMGADPIHVLLTTGAGHLMLLIGSVLSCAGLVWTARIVRG